MNTWEPCRLAVMVRDFQRWWEVHLEALPAIRGSCDVQDCLHAQLGVGVVDANAIPALEEGALKGDLNNLHCWQPTINTPQSHHRLQLLRISSSWEDACMQSRTTTLCSLSLPPPPPNHHHNASRQYLLLNLFHDVQLETPRPRK